MNSSMFVRKCSRSSYLLVKMEPMASRTASETRFSEGMSSRPVAWRLASSRRRPAICGSTESSGRFMRSLASVVLLIVVPRLTGPFAGSAWAARRFYRMEWRKANLQWPDARRLVGVGKREARGEMENENRNNGGGQRRNRALVVRTEPMPKTEWPAHDSTDAPAYRGVGKREAGER